MKEMENKYFTPSLEDLRVGYECEVQREIPLGLLAAIENRPEFYDEWEKIVIGKRYIGSNILTQKEIEKVFNEFFYPTPHVEKCEFYLKHGKLRTPYLTKEQIEADGWKVKTDNNNGVIDFENPEYCLISWNYTLKIIEINDRKTTSRFDNQLYRGQCKDINTFRYICKLLNI